MSAAEMISKLQAAAHKLDEAKSKAAAATQDANEARTLVAGALEGSAAGPLVGTIDRIRDSLHQAAGAVDPARQHVQQTIEKAQALGN